MEKLYPHTSIHNIGGVFVIYGHVDFLSLNKAIKHFIRSHAGARIRIIETPEGVFQYVSNEEDIEIEFHDFQNINNPDISFKKWADDEMAKPIPLIDNRLYLFSTFKVNDEYQGYLIKFHHIASDGWSMRMLTDHIKDTYICYLNGSEPSKKEYPSYIDFILEEQRYLYSEKSKLNQRYWKQELREIPNKIPSVSHDSVDGSRRREFLSEEAIVRARRICERSGVTLNTLFTALTSIIFSKLYDQRELIIGVPIYNRLTKKQKETFGMFTSSMPFRIEVDDHISFENFIKKCHQKLKLGYLNQRYPYNLIVRDIEGGAGTHNLFDVCVNYYNTKHAVSAAGYKVESVDLYSGDQIFALQIVIKDWGSDNKIEISFDYKRPFEDLIDRLHAYFELLIDDIYNTPRTAVKDFLLLTKQEFGWLRKAGRGAAEDPYASCIIKLFENQANIAGDRIALEHDGQQISYSELNRRSNQLARFIIEQRNFRPKGIIGVCMGHRIETVISILSILKVGCAYMPLEPGIPVERKLYQLKNSNVLILMSDSHEAGFGYAGEVINVLGLDFSYEDDGNLGVESEGSDLVYVIYTSGSTGEPNGVMVSNSNLINYICWAKRKYVESDNEVFALYSPFSFDLTITSIFAPLIGGNRIIVYSDEKGFILHKILNEGRVSIIKLTPSHLRLLTATDSDSSSIKVMIVGGENLEADLVLKAHYLLGGKARIFNEYGPTEATVGCIVYEYKAGESKHDSVPIGKPIDNTDIYILNHNMQQMPIGITGEIYIAGASITKGYINNSQKTQAKFVRNPLNGMDVIYKTGDLGYYDYDGQIMYCGRSDSQIKLRGYRIELDEIQLNILKHASVKQAAVKLIKRDNNANYICAYIEAWPIPKVDEEEIKKFLSNTLPQYMVPDRIVFLERMPITRNGKIDLSSLPLPKERKGDTSGVQAGRETLALKNAIKQVLNVAGDVGVDQNFYDLGGDSISAVQISQQMSKFGIELQIKDILENPIIGKMAEFVRALRDNDDSMSVEGELPRSVPILEWFFGQKSKNRNHYVQSVLVEAGPRLTLNKVFNVLEALIKRHDTFRLFFNPRNNRLEYRSVEECKPLVQESDFKHLSGSQLIHGISKEGESFKSGFDVCKGNLLGAMIFHLDGRDLLLLVAHHIAIDGYSWRIMLDEISILLDEEKVEPLKAVRCTYKRWAESLEVYQSNILKDEVDFWNRIVSHSQNHEIAMLQERVSKGLESSVAQTHSADAAIPDDITEKLLNNANRAYSTNVLELLISALLLTIREMTNADAIVIDLESHGRYQMNSDIDISGTIGWFTSIYPVLFSSNSGQLSDIVEEVKRVVRGIKNYGIGYGILRYVQNELRDPNSNKRIRFNYLGNFDPILRNGNIKFIEYGTGIDVAKENSLDCLIQMNLLIINRKLRVSMTYNLNEFSKRGIIDVLDCYCKNIKAVVEHCLNMATEAKGFNINISDDLKDDIYELLE